ncbi:MAG: hypothetical protein NTX85_00450 [Candidatus Nomurabacteria bacterium]|nr:hypothetical protein [Candidatus Nomurabacteria bacterium]
MKKTIQYSISSLLILTSVMPFFAFAEEAIPETTSIKTTPATTIAIPQGNNFCAKIPAIGSKLGEQILNSETKKRENEARLAVNTTKKEADIDAKRASGRADTDSKRIKTADKLNTKAKTDTQKVAVTTYTKAINDSVTARRTAIDAAVKIYRDGITALYTTKSTDTDINFTTFKSSIDGAIQKATADCANKVASKTVSTTFNKSLKDARAAFTANNKLSVQNTQIKALKDTRDAAFKKAEADFKQATDKARADLIMAMK